MVTVVVRVGATSAALRSSHSAVLVEPMDLVTGKSESSQNGDSLGLGHNIHCYRLDRYTTELGQAKPGHMHIILLHISDSLDRDTALIVNRLNRDTTLIVTRLDRDTIANRNCRVLAKKKEMW